MSHDLHNFIPAHEVLESAIRFHEKAASLFDAWAKPELGERERTFLPLVAAIEREAAKALATYAGEHEDLASLETWFQNAPGELPPNDALEALEAHAGDTPLFCSELHAVHNQWLHVYEAFEKGAPIERVRELFASCRALLLSKQQALSSAQNQLRDM